MSNTKVMIDSFGRTPEENADRQEIMEAANQEARENWKDPQWRAEFAADLTESILQGFDYETLIDRWIVTERVGFNDRSFLRERGGLKAFYMARGGYIEASELTSEVTEMPRDMIGVHVSEFEDKFLTNFSESAQDLRDLSIRRMDAEVNRRVRTLLAEAIDSSSPYYTSASGLGKASLDGAISAVRDESKLGEITIVGRPTMTDQICDFDGFGNETKEEIRRKGVLGVYRGATIVSLKNFKDEDGNAYIPANELWVLGRDAGKFVFYGGIQSKEFSELDNWYWHYLGRRDSGIMVHKPERARRIIDSSVAA